MLNMGRPSKRYRLQLLQEAVNIAWAHGQAKQLRSLSLCKSICQPVHQSHQFVFLVCQRVSPSPCLLVALCCSLLLTALSCALLTLLRSVAVSRTLSALSPLSESSPVGLKISLSLSLALFLQHRTGDLLSREALGLDSATSDCTKL